MTYIKDYLLFIIDYFDAPGVTYVLANIQRKSKKVWIL